jgi:hypothetical protein
MTGLGRRCRAAETAEDLQIEEVLTPMENRYLGNSGVIMFIAICQPLYTEVFHIRTI